MKKKSDNLVAAQVREVARMLSDIGLVYLSGGLPLSNKTIHRAWLDKAVGFLSTLAWTLEAEGDRERCGRMLDQFAAHVGIRAIDPPVLASFPRSVAISAMLAARADEGTALRHKLWMIACHATGGGIQTIEGSDRSINDICVQITAWHNKVYQAAIDATLADVSLATSQIEAGESLSGEDAWQELVEFDDRTSPEEYPDMCLITRDELIDFMNRRAGIGAAARNQERTA